MVDGWGAWKWNWPLSDEMKTPGLDRDSATNLSRQAKTALRRRLSSLRRALPTSAAAERSARIVSRLLCHPWLEAAQSVALYAAMRAEREPDLTALHHALRERDVRIFYPFMDKSSNGYTTGFRLLRSSDELTTRGRPFAEPCPDAPTAQRGDVDVAIVPALGVTQNGYRLGMGSGFYDSTLPDLCPPAKSIVIGYDFQLLIELPIEAHDWQCDDVLIDAAGQ